MSDRNGPDPEQLLDARLEAYRERGVRRVKIGLTDIDGVIRGKYVSLEKFIGLMRKGGGFCDCVFGWDVDDQLYEQPDGFTGWHTGFPDAHFRLIAASERWLADESTPYFIGEFVGADDGLHPLCPRSRLADQVARFDQMGLKFTAGFEYEFFVFNETSHSVRDKGYRNLTPLTPGNFGYSVLRTSSEAQAFTDLMDFCGDIDCDLEGLHCETGPGVWEAALAASVGVEAADRANLFKTFAKVFFARQEKIATFMAKWSMDYPGQSGHCHFSLADDQQNIFFDAADDGAEPSQKLPPRLGHAVGGLLRYLPEVLVMLAPTVNSYTRLVKGAWAPTAATWGIENRTAAIRVIPGSASSQRIECRVGGADANPYLVACAVAACVRRGLVDNLDPGEPVSGNAYDLQDALDPALKFPGNLREAAARMDASAFAREAFGDEFVDHFVMTRHYEADERDRHIDSWQMGRYFEII
jgi:glutamine synthetase